MDRWHDGGWGWGGWVAMAVMMLVFWSVIAAVVVTLVRTRRHDGRVEVTGSLHHDAERVLNERFARGEIDEEEFERRRDVLRR